MVSNGILAGTREHGRELASMSKNGTTWNFTYDANDMRTARSDGSTAYTYVYNGSQLSQMTVAGNTLNFTYDASGSPLSVSYGGATYYYVTNLQGDVVAILNSSGTSVVTYTYDAWGKLLTTSGSMASTLGVHNPLRYRGYVYDTDTELYYLQSRYYDPQIGRFINADSLVTTGNGMASSNIFAYCNNNPIMGCDPCGTCFHRWDFWNDCEDCGGQTIEDKWNDYCENGLTLVFTVGVSGSVNLGAFDVSGSFEVAADLKGNVQIVGSFSFDVTTTGAISASVGVCGSAYVMPDTSYLAGDTYYTGGSIYVPNPAGGNTVGLSGNVGFTSDGYGGVMGSMGIGTLTAVGADFHGGYVKTTALSEKFNVFDFVASLF